MAWTLVDSAFDPDVSGAAHCVVTVQEGDLIVLVHSERGGYDGTISVSDDGDASNPYVEAPNCPIVWKPADSSYRTFGDVWLKVANATDAGTLDVEVADIPGNHWASVAVLRPGAGDGPIDLSSMIGVVGGTDANDEGGSFTSVSTASISPASATYLKLGVGIIKKDVLDHGPFAYDQDVSAVLENNDGGATGMAHGVGIHLDTESTSQALTFTITTAASRTLLAAYVLIPEAFSTASLYATGDGTIADVVDENDVATGLFDSVDDDPASPDDADWVNNAVEV